jgi:leucine dehydrogenase
MTGLDLARQLGHEELLVVRDEAAGLHAIVAIHDTTFGPAVGGTRMRPYASLDAALTDALRLSRAMTYKAVMAGVERGGAKAVILGDPAKDKSRALLQAYARLLERLGGRFHTGPDMGIDGRDVAVLRRMTKHITYAVEGAKLNAADLTALGVLESVRAVASLLGTELSGLRVAVQGLGEVGSRLARLLAEAGARLTLSDVDEGRAERVATQLSAARIAPDAVYDVEADVFSPNAMGGILNDETIPRLRCRAVCGAANEQLLEPRHGDALDARGILFAPDYVANAGGLLSLLFELGETDEAGITRRVIEIGGRLRELLERSRAESVPPHRMADRVVEERLAEAKARRGARG